MALFSSASAHAKKNEMQQKGACQAEAEAAFRNALNLSASDYYVYFTSIEMNLEENYKTEQFFFTVTKPTPQSYFNFTVSFYNYDGMCLFNEMTNTRAPGEE